MNELQVVKEALGLKDICDIYHSDMRHMYAVLPTVFEDEESQQLLDTNLAYLYKHTRCCKVCDHNKCPILYGLSELNHKEDLTEHMNTFADLVVYHLNNCPHCGGFR